MRISNLLQFLMSFVFLAIAFLFVTGWLTTEGHYEAYQKRTSGVVGQPAEAAEVNHLMQATATIAPIDGYTYAGQLDATIIFTDGSGAETVFDLHYPTDYSTFHDGFGPLWLANWRPDIANNPQVTPVLGNSCLQTIRGENLAPSRRYQTGYKEYLVCRVLDEEGPDDPPSYDISTAKPAVIGIIWANRNHQPMDYPRERCIAEARIWSTEVAKPGDRFMVCVFVINEDPQQVETFAFELTEDSIVEIAGTGAGERWSRKDVDMRAAPHLMRYRLMQDWLADPQAHDAAVNRTYSHLTENLDQIAPLRVSQFDSVEQKNGLINFTFRAKNTDEMFRIRDRSRNGTQHHLFKHIRKVACGSDERAALLAFQENALTYTYELNRSDGRPMTAYAAFPNMPC